MQITPWMIIWAIASPILGAVGVGVITYVLNYKAIQVANKADHDRIEGKVNGLGSSFDQHCKDQQEKEVTQASMLGGMDANIKLLLERHGSNI